MGEVLRRLAAMVSLALLGVTAGGCGNGSSAVASGPAFGKSARISDNAATGWFSTWSSGKRNVCGGEDNLYAVWLDDRNGGPAPDVWLARSTDGGRTFGPNVKVNDNNTAPSRDLAAVATDGAGNVYVVWVDDRTGDTDVYLAASRDGGRTFSPEVRVNGIAGTEIQRDPSLLARAGGEVLVVWVDNRSAPPEIYLARSTDFGSTFGERPLYQTDPNPFTNIALPSVAADSTGRIYVVAQARGLGRTDTAFLSILDNVLATSPTLVVVDNTVPPSRQNDPAVAATGNGRVFVAWWDDRRGGRDVYFARSIDGGNTFSGAQRLNEPTSGDKDRPSLAADNTGVVFVAWRDARNGPVNIYGTKSLDSGATFSANFRIDDDGTGAGKDDVSVGLGRNGKGQAIWRDDRIPAGVYFGAEL